MRAEARIARKSWPRVLSTLYVCVPCNTTLFMYANVKNLLPPMRAFHFKNFHSGAAAVGCCPGRALVMPQATVLFSFSCLELRLKLGFNNCCRPQAVAAVALALQITRVRRKREGGRKW